MNTAIAANNNGSGATFVLNSSISVTDKKGATCSSNPAQKLWSNVKANIPSNNKSKEFKTIGLDSDQTVAAIKATIKMLNTIENM